MKKYFYHGSKDYPVEFKSFYGNSTLSCRWRAIILLRILLRELPILFAYFLSSISSMAQQE
jgi:hypothetical protein